MNLYFKVRVRDHNKKEIKRTAFNLFWNRFEIVTADGYDKIKDGSFFEVVEGKCVASRRKHEYKQSAAQCGRDIVTMRYNYPSALRQFIVGDVLVILKPCNNFFSKKPKDASKKYVYDPLNSLFISLTKAEWIKSGFSKFRKGDVIGYRNEAWSKITDQKFGDIKSELDLADIDDVIQSNLIAWNSNVNELCAKCKKTCKQTDTMQVMACKNFERNEANDTKGTKRPTRRKRRVSK